MLADGTPVPGTADPAGTPPADPAYLLSAPEPGDGIATMGLTDAGVDPAEFMQAITPLYDGSMLEVHSVLVLSRGALVFEDYFIGNTDRLDFDRGLVRLPGEPRQWRPDDLHYVASVAKTVTSLVCGIAFDELGWSPDERLAPRLASAPWLLAGDKSGITARHILTMTSGIEWDEWRGDSHVATWRADGRFRHFASRPMEARPGDRWTYNSIAPNVLLLAIDGAVDGGVRAFADARLFSPLGIDNYRWGGFEGDIPDGGARFFLRPRDMAKIGLLIRNHGEWNGRQIVPRAYIDAATSPQVSTAPAAEHEYGFLTWIRKVVPEGGEPVQYIAVEGDGGNQINIFPDRDLIVVTTGGNYGEFPVYEAQCQRLLRRLLPLFEQAGAVP